MRRLLLIALASFALAGPAAAFPSLPATPDKLDLFASELEGMHGSSRIADQRIADMLRPFAATEGVTIPAIAPAYTAYPSSAEKLRPKGWLIEIGELNNGWVTATVDKWDTGGLAAVHEKGGRNNLALGDVRGALALSAGMLRAWAQDMREAAAPAPTATALNWTPAPLTVGGYAFLKNQGSCCNGLVIKLLSVNPATGMWAGVYLYDSSGNFPSSNPYWRSLVSYQNQDNLQGVTYA